MAKLTQYIKKSMNVLHHINRIKNKIAQEFQYAKKPFDQIQHHFMVRNSQQTSSKP
jgi:hypothetical protein